MSEPGSSDWEVISSSTLVSGAPPALQADLVSMPGAILGRIFSFLPRQHPEEWTQIGHYDYVFCGQSCPCCRFVEGEAVGTCTICEQGIVLRDVCLAGRTALYCLVQDPRIPPASLGLS